MDNNTNNSLHGNFVKQAAFLAIASLLSRFIGFLYHIPMTALIGDEGNGIYARAYYVYNFFLILSSAGMPAAISKLVAERTAVSDFHGAHRVFRVALIVALGFGVVFAAVILFGAGFITTAMNSPRSFYALLALSPTVFICAIMAIFRGYFQGLGTAVPTSVSQVTEQIFNAAFSLILASAFMGLSGAYADRPAFGAAGGTAGTGAGALFGLLAVCIFYFLNRKKVAAPIKTQAETKKEKTSHLAWLIIRTTLPIIAGTAVLSFSNLIDASMVTERLVAGGFSATEADVLYGQLSGKYSRIVTLAISIATVLAMASIPSISSSKALKDHKAVESKIRTALRLTMLICVPAAGGLAALGEPIVAMLFRAYPEGGMLLQVGAVNVILIALNQILTGPLQATGYLKIPVIAALCGAAVKIAANMVLIPIPAINIHGAVISTALCYITAASINWYWLRKSTGMRLGFVRLMKKPVLASAVMGGICFGAHRLLMAVGLGNTISVLAAIVLGFAVYAAVMFAIKGIDRQDLLMLRIFKK